MPRSLALALTFIVDRTLSLPHTHTYTQTYVQTLTLIVTLALHLHNIPCYIIFTVSGQNARYVDGENVDNVDGEIRIQQRCYKDVTEAL